MELKHRIQSLATDIWEEVVEKRRHLHANPELSFQEKQTAAFVSAELDKLQIRHESDVAGHGVVGYIEGTKPGNGPTIALRGDMDALPIIETNDVPYKSTNPGVMHACGHDVHTSSLLGSAKILQSIRDQFSGTIKLLFQPAEEKFPGGASLMIDAGVLRNPDVQAIFGQHVMPYFPTGKIGVRPGMYMASADEIYMRVKGVGGHAAQPAHFIDPVMITSQILVTLQQVVSRSDPRTPSILSFGKVIAEGATNIIPNEVYIEGTFRTMNETWRAQAHQKIHDIAHNIAAALGGSVELDIKKGYPVLHNDEALTTQARDHIADYIGEENIIDMDLWMAAEDFSYFTHEVPGCFYRLGTRNEARGIVHGLHTPQFNIDEDAMKLSTGLMAWLAVKRLMN
ncbi:M20 family metallopeptidase [Pontibacter sp. G13]|uniref:M20 metallopeptidase family protein n=1 Tax=Pontibacter sp. G13 TaxID=3074898 RepID=UPI00288B8245|nr:M20 family metallopeptidase [Pontibacter sp. G13]WNJ16501.1 M20 family metallopeptidase [Pontibacter sp. G13]